MSAMLERFRRAKAAEIEMLNALEAQRRLPDPWGGERPGFAKALRGPDLAVIAEYKRASPSRGVIELGLEPEAVARAYAEAGAACLSVLTEEAHFQGSLDYLFRMAEPVSGPGPAPRLPLLRKDFLLDPLQITQSAATPASAVLLIVRMLPGGLLAEMLAACAHYGLEAVVEVFSEDDLDRAQAAGAAIIQVNNRDLDTLATDLSTAEKLATRRASGADDDTVWIAASGLETAEDAARMRSAGYEAVLVGTALMRGGDPKGALQRLLGTKEEP